jgi:FtsH-binding integral membrane protein
MRQGSGISASVGAIASALATITCCLPLGFAAAIGAAGAGAFLERYRPWLLGLSVVLLALGFWQQQRARQCAVKGRVVGQVLLWVAVVVVGGMILFPQQIAGFLADRFSWAPK